MAVIHVDTQANHKELKRGAIHLYKQPGNSGDAARSRLRAGKAYADVGQAKPKRDMSQAVRSLPARAGLTWRSKSCRNIGIMELPGKGRQPIIWLSWQFPCRTFRARTHMVNGRSLSFFGVPNGRPTGPTFTSRAFLY